MERNWKHFAAMVLIGDGVMAVLNPQADAQAWKHGPAAWQGLMKELRKNPTLTRILGVTQIGAGVVWALHQQQTARRFSPPEHHLEDENEDALVR